MRASRGGGGSHRRCWVATDEPGYPCIARRWTAMDGERCDEVGGPSPRRRVPCCRALQRGAASQRPNRAADQPQAQVTGRSGRTERAAGQNARWPPDGISGGH